MSVGLGGNITVNQKKKAAGAPFAAGSANDGVSVDAGSKKIVLGDELGAGTALSVLLTDRVIPTGFFELWLATTIAALQFIRLSPNNAIVNVSSDATTGPTPQFSLVDLSSGNPLQVLYNDLQGGSLGTPFGTFRILPTAKFQLFSGAPPVDDGAKLQVNGDVTTSDPGSGKGKWQLGAPVAAAVALDITKYVEVKINGVVVKLGVVV
jgi:hypothetical protein